MAAHRDLASCGFGHQNTSYMELGSSGGLDLSRTYPN